jgi:hypothetical protein
MVACLLRFHLHEGKLLRFKIDSGLTATQMAMDEFTKQ